MRDRFRLSSSSVPPPSQSSPGEGDNRALNEVWRPAVIIEPRGDPILRMIIRIGVVCVLLVGIATFVVPSIIRNRKRPRATRLIDDPRQLGQNVDFYTTEWGLTGGTSINWTQIRTQLKASPRPNQNSAVPAAGF